MGNPTAANEGNDHEQGKGRPASDPTIASNLELLQELRQCTGGYGDLFPGIRRPASTPMSAETINKALKIMGFEDKQTGHGFRGLASTILNDHHVAGSEAIEWQLSHK